MCTFFDIIGEGWWEGQGGDIWSYWKNLDKGEKSGGKVRTQVEFYNCGIH
jgi:hypothetical protein